MAYIYFLEHPVPGGLIKIGRSKNPEKRVAYFQAHSPVPLSLLFFMEGDAKLESKLHRRFSEFRRHGDWFEPSGEILKFIEEQREALLQNVGEPLLSVGEAADFLDLRPQDVLRLCEHGELSPVYTKGGHRRFRQADLEATQGITFR
jgi:excisionase family DNA binding protein